jgi:hypothetical protein
MGRSWMVVVKKYRWLISNYRIEGNTCLEKKFLHISGQIGPKLKGCMT